MACGRQGEESWSVESWRARSCEEGAQRAEREPDAPQAGKQATTKCFEAGMAVEGEGDDWEQPRLSSRRLIRASAVVGCHAVLGARRTGRRSVEGSLDELAVPFRRVDRPSVNRRTSAQGDPLPRLMDGRAGQERGLQMQLER